MATRLKIKPLFDHPSSLRDWIGFSFRVECGNIIKKERALENIYLFVNGVPATILFHKQIKTC